MARTAPRRSTWRRTRWTAAAVATALGATLASGIGTTSAAPASQQPDAFNKGTGQAIAQTYRLDPVAGGLSFGVGIGEALAAHQNQVATAEARAINLGVIGVTLAGDACDGGDPDLAAEDQPQAVRTDSNQPDAATPHTETESFAGGQITKTVRATRDPFAEAVTTSAPFEIPGILRIANSRATAHSGIIDGTTREAVALTEVGSISIGGGIVVFNDVRWEAIHHTGAVEDISGTFSIGSATIAGSPTPTNDPTATLAEANAVLEVLGLQVRPPTYHVAQTSGGNIAVVDPMSVAVIPNSTRDGAVGPVIGGLQPTREDVFNALLEQECGTGTYITVFDILLAAMTGGGEFSVKVGGVQATTAALNRFSFGDRPAPFGNVAVPFVPGVNLPSTGGFVPGTGGAVATPAPAPTDTGGAAPRPASFAEAVGERGGPMAWVAATGLLLLLAAAEGDRRKMRRAQREIPVEV